MQLVFMSPVLCYLTDCTTQAQIVPTPPVKYGQITLASEQTHLQHNHDGLFLSDPLTYPTSHSIQSK